MPPLPSKGTANVSPSDLKHLRPLIRHIADKGPHFFGQCMDTKGVIARFPNPLRRKKVCAVLKDLHEGNTDWRKGKKKH